MIDPAIFRAYDIRGIVGAGLTPDGVKRIGRAFAGIIRERSGQECPVIVTGHDGRLSSPPLEQAFIDGILEGGADGVRIGLGPTPMLYFARHRLDADAAAMITGSHNPPDYNGLKLMAGRLPFHGPDIAELACLASRPDDGKRLPAGSHRRIDVSGAYVARLLDDVLPGRNLAVIWDAGNGATGQVLCDLVGRLPGYHEVLFGEIDGRFPNHHPDPSAAENLEALIDAVVRRRADLGIALDGDGDRIGVVDARGRVVPGDRLMMLWASDLLRDHPGATVIADVKSSQSLFDEILRLGGRPLMWRTGHSLIKEEMAKTGCLLAGEASGHIFFADRYPGYDDALYAAVRLLNILAHEERSLAELHDAMPRLVATPEVRIACEDDRKFAVVEEVRERLRRSGAAMSEIDGVRVRTTSGWWLLRASNTEPLLSIRCEAGDQPSLDRVILDLCFWLEPSGITLPDL